MNLIYHKKCLGKNNKPITIYKIRTMEPEADKNLEKIINEKYDSLGKPMEDPRITPAGKILRKYWIDELPQIYNLIKGDIKLVGIRPKSKKSWEIYPPRIMEESLKQKPGFFGIQYASPYSENFNDNLRHMEDYLGEWKESPFKTDMRYFLKITQNIAKNKMRGR